MRSWLLLLTSLAVVAAQAAPPRQIEIAYEVSVGGLPVATVTDRLEHDGRSYSLSETWKGRGALALSGEIKRASRGVVTASGLQPLDYLDERSGRAPTRASFDWKARTLKLESRGEVQSLSFSGSPLDALSVFFSFAFRPPDGKPVSLDVTDGRRLTNYLFEPAGREQVKTPAGEFDALHFVRRGEGSSSSGEVWLAAARDYLPVRIVIVDRRGTRLDQVVTRISVP